MFVCNESIVSKLIGIVYLKVNNCSFFIYIKYVCFLRKFAQKEEGFRTGKQIRHRLRLRSPTPTPTPSPMNWCPGTRPNNSSFPEPGSCSWSQVPAGQQSEQSQSSATFLASCQGSTGQPERTIIRSTPSWAKKRTKKTRA